jgi:hypothetical protein
LPDSLAALTTVSLAVRIVAKLQFEIAEKAEIAEFSAKKLHDSTSALAP